MGSSEGRHADIAERFAPGGWSFTSDVVAVFDEHVRASVPHYDVIQNLVASIAGWLIPAGGTYADLGASTGTTADLIATKLADRPYSVALYDEQLDMLEEARTKLARLGDRLRCYSTPIQAGHLNHANADLTTALFTLQFLRHPDRFVALRNARKSAAITGALLIAEKVRPADSRWAEIANDLSHDWKAEHGISDEAIRAKSRALRGVLRPTSADALIRLVEEAGWGDVEILFRWNNWLLLGAFANGGDVA